MLFHRLFEMDYDQHTKEYRMLDDFMPEVRRISKAFVQFDTDAFC